MDPGLRAPAVAVSVDGTITAVHELRIGSQVRGAERLTKIRETLSFYLNSFPIIHAGAIEGPSLQSTHREYDMGEASGVLREYVYSTYRVECVVVPPTSLKKYATGSGAADKAQMIQYAVRELGVSLSVHEDDAADAAHLADLAFFLTSDVRPRTRAAAEVLHQLRAPTKRSKKPQRPFSI